jgi:cell division protein FtsN
MPATVGGRPLHRVRVGPVSTVEEFDALIDRLRGLGVVDARLALN